MHSVEFETKAGCMFAKEQVESSLNGFYGEIRASCIERRTPAEDKS